MAVQINTYGGLKAGMLAWLARSGDSLLDSRFDDFLLNCERRMYYGFAADDPANPLKSDPLRIDLMETVDPAFALSSGTVPQPATFLELISAQLNSPNAPLEIVSQRTIDGYGPQSLGGTSDPRSCGDGAMSVIPFAEWRPDMPDLGQWAREALNVIPAEESYRPL